jgi:CubicO group peptidase (beta-lactamase class C family)
VANRRLRCGFLARARRERGRAHQADRVAGDEWPGGRLRRGRLQRTVFLTASNERRASMRCSDHAGFLLAAAVAAHAAVWPNAPPPEDIDAVARRLAQLVPGVQIAVWREGGVAAEAVAGWADIARRVPVTTSTRFPVYSAAKAWTATAAARLVEQGRVSPDDRIGDLVPDFPPKRWSFTLMQLARHQAGIRHYRDNAEAWDLRPCATVSDAVRLFEGDPLEFEPGTRTAYSSWGYVLLSRVIEVRTALPFPQALSQLVLAPAQMTRTAAARAAVDAGNVASAYRPGPGGHEYVTIDPGCKWGAGGYYSTAGDLVRFYGALTSGRLVSGPMQSLILDAGPDGRFSFGGASLGGQSRIAGLARDGVFVAIVVNEQNPALDLDAAAASLLARDE